MPIMGSHRLVTSSNLLKGQRGSPGMLVANKRTGVSGGDADSGVPSGVMLALLLDWVDLRLKLNLWDDRRCLECCVDDTFFCVMRVILQHLQAANMSELSSMILSFSVLIRCSISVLSTMQGLQTIVLAEFIHWIHLPPCHRMEGSISFSLVLT